MTLLRTVLVIALLACFCRVEAAFVSVSAMSCEKTKSCMRSPPACTGQSDCDYFLSWRPVNTSSNAYVEVEMSGKVRSNTGYVAIGFSEDAKMGNDAVVGCIASPAGAVSIRAAVNPVPPPLTNKFVTSSPPGLLVTSGVKDAGGKDVLGGAFTSSSNIVSCRLRRQLKPSSNLNELKDLSPPRKYYILVSRSSSTTATGLAHHFSGANVVSSESYDVGSEAFKGAVVSTYPLVKAHAGLMMVAWMLCANVGIIMARYFKPMWPEKRMMGKNLWFQFHRCIQSTCVLLTIIGFVLIFVQLGGYSGLTALPGSAHPIIGIIVTALAIINPIMALFRPKPDAARRPIFNWLHFLVGSLAQLLSIVTMFIGLKLQKVGAAFAQLNYPFWILVGFVAFIIVMEVLFALDYYCLKKRVAHGSGEYQMNATTDINGNQAAVNMSGNPTTESVNTSRRTMLLGLHLVGTVAFTATLVTIMAFN